MSAKVLVVEDNPDNMKLINWVLEDEGYLTTGVVTGEDALETIEPDKFDIVLMDIDLPGINGEEVTRRLRADDAYKELPIIAVTAHAIKSEVSTIMSAGFTALTTKPIDETELVNLIKRFLREEE